VAYLVYLLNNKPKRRLLCTYSHQDINHTDLDIIEQASLFLAILTEITR